MTDSHGTDDGPATSPRDPFAPIRQVTDPEMAAAITEAARRRARELLEEGEFKPDVLAKIVATLGPVRIDPTPTGAAHSQPRTTL